jgi:hypothetical protein
VTKLIWIKYSPTGLTAKGRADLADAGQRLEHARRSVDAAQRALNIDRFRRREKERLGARRSADGERLLAAFHVLCDLAKQGWLIRVRADEINISRPSNPLDPDEDRLRIREQLHAKRDEQLRQESVRAFIRSMEARKMWNGKMVSIFSLMRDGRDLARAIRAGTEPVQPYLQFLDGENRCELTGYRLMDIWRYFRHTWTTPYGSVPGRTMMVIVRDRAVPFHPVVGIAALSSATVGLSVRDEYVGWTSKQVIERIIADPSPKYGKWMIRVIDEAVGDIYVNDLLARETLTIKDFANPTPEVIQRLVSLSRGHRKDHYRFMQGKDYKDNINPETATDNDWEQRAKSLLFISKREQELANLFSIRIALNEHLGDKPTAANVKAFVESRDGRLALARLIRKAKADRVGTVIADLTICGAIAPYNEVLGGKLVAMLMSSPEVAQEYRRRYRKMPSIIASSMAGRALVRASDLVFISTTSLYGRRPNQYDRLAIPTDEIVEGATGVVRYEYLGKTRGYGTFQFGEDTTASLSTVLSQTSQGQRVNYVFGEGVNPRLRMLRDALDEMGLSSNTLLDHGAPRLVYAVALVRNLTDYLLGIDKSPDFMIPLARGTNATAAIGAWWFLRWSKNRVQKEGVLDEIEKQTLVHPIRHGARVKLPPTLAEEQYLFED